MNKPSWADAPDWANWQAMDHSGNWFWYEFEPVALLVSKVFLDTQGRYESSIYGAIDEAWEETLERRP